jgi:hypothetical protein
VIYKDRLAALMVLLAGCPGQYGGLEHQNQLDRGPVAFLDLPPSTKVDGKSQPVSIDLRAPDKGGPVLTPDKSAPKPDQPPPNGNCPCPGTQICVQNKCYTKCTPTGGCNADSTCAATELCILVTNQNVYVCMTATTTLNGQCAPAGPWCPNHLVCVTKSGQATGTCRPQCANGQCSSGVCTQYQACFFCLL